MTEHEVYLSRYASPELDLEDVDAEMVVVIPAYKEHGVSRAIYSLISCIPPCEVAILVVINHPESAEEPVKELSRKTQEEILSIDAPKHIHIRAAIVELPDKKAGVGLARKIGLDQAVRWFDQNCINGIMVCFDADCECSPNYLHEIYRVFTREGTDAGIIFYEHPLDHSEIINYEIYLRYYVDALRWAGHPFVPQTLGSCIAINSYSYCRVGGMNTRLAGEDFYFLHKLMGKVRFKEINEATVYPSSRISDRVPFGTGKALHKSRSGDAIKCYNPRSYQSIHQLLSKVPSFYKGPLIIEDPLLEQFLENEKFRSEMDRIRSGTSNENSFRKQFFQWFDGFRILKLLHFFRDNGLDDVTVEEGVKWLDEEYWRLGLEKEDPKNRLLRIRTQNRSPFNYGVF